MGILETARLVIRPLAMNDLQFVHRILDLELQDIDMGTEGKKTLEERTRWLQWTILNYEELAKLRQPPFGERAIQHKSTGQLVGICGFVPCLDHFEQLCDFEATTATQPSLATTEFGLFYAISPASQGQGFGTEGASAMVAYAFEHLHLKRIVATTTHNNAASIAVMRKLGMRLKKNPLPTPPWLQVVGLLPNPAK